MYKNLLSRIIRKALSICQSILLSYPKRVRCNVCDWQGHHFVSDSWHKHLICPVCHSDVRHRLFIAALQHIENLSFDNIIRNKKILHFAPEKIVKLMFQTKTTHYTTADFLRKDCDLKLDMSNMPDIENQTVDTVIAFDVLEHVPDYQKALNEVHRILCVNGFAIFTVPQKDGLSHTYEDSTIITPEERTKHFGQWDHLRIFGANFPDIIENKGFEVIVINESSFSDEMIKKHVLFPPYLSEHPLATNFRKVFFCRKR